MVIIELEEINGKSEKSLFLQTLWESHRLRTLSGRPKYNLETNTVSNFVDVRRSVLRFDNNNKKVDLLKRINFAAFGIRKLKM